MSFDLDNIVSDQLVRDASDFSGGGSGPVCRLGCYACVCLQCYDPAPPTGPTPTPSPVPGAPIPPPTGTP